MDHNEIYENEIDVNELMEKEDLKKVPFDKENIQHVFIVQMAYDNAMSFGTGYLTAIEEELENNNIEYTETAERYVFDRYVDDSDPI